MKKLWTAIPGLNFGRSYCWRRATKFGTIAQLQRSFAMPRGSDDYSCLWDCSALRSNKCLVTALLCLRPQRGVCLTSVCLSRTSGLTREQRGLGRLKLAEVAHVTRTACCILVCRTTKNQDSLLSCEISDMIFIWYLRVVCVHISGQMDTYLVKADCYECVDSRSNGEAEITHLRQLFLRMQEHLITYKHLIIHNDRYTVYVRRRTDNPKTHRRFRKNITQWITKWSNAWRHLKVCSVHLVP